MVYRRNDERAVPALMISDHHHHLQGREKSGRQSAHVCALKWTAEGHNHRIRKPRSGGGNISHRQPPLPSSTALRRTLSTGRLPIFWLSDSPGGGAVQVSFCLRGSSRRAHVSPDGRGSDIDITLSNRHLHFSMIVAIILLNCGGHPGLNWLVGLLCG